MSSLVTSIGLASYPKVFKSELPKDPSPTDKPAWSVTMLMDLAGVESAEFKAIHTTLIASLRERWGPTVKDKVEYNEKGEGFVRFDDAPAKPGGPAVPGFLRVPYRNDCAAKGYPDDVVLFFNARKTDDPEKNMRPPEVVNRRGEIITDRREVYPGVRCRISVGVFTYVSRGNKGVSLGLNNFQKVGDGPRIDDSKSAKDEFGEAGALPEEEDDAAVLAGITQ